MTNDIEADMVAKFAEWVTSPQGKSCMEDSILYYSNLSMYEDVLKNRLAAAFYSGYASALLYETSNQKSFKLQIETLKEALWLAEYTSECAANDK